MSGAFAVEASDPSMGWRLDVGPTVAVRDDPAPPTAPCLRGDSTMLIEALSIRAPFPEAVPGEWLPLLEGLARAFDAELPSGH